MKRNAKIITLAIAAALILCMAIGFTTSAETSSTAPEVVAKNVKVDGNFCLMFAVDPATVAGDDVTLKIYAEAPDVGVEPIYNVTKAKTETSLICLDNDSQIDDPAVVFETSGVSAKDIADTWWFTAESAGAVSEVQTYSVREYAFERLYGDNKIAAEDDYGIRQREFYLSILQVGSTAQDLLVNTKLEAEGKTPERLANEYSYAAIFSGNFGGVAQKFVEIGDTLTLTADAGVSTWQVITYGKTGTLLSKQSVLLGATVTVAGNTVIIPDPTFGTTVGKYFEHIGEEKFNFNSLASMTNGDYGVTSFRLGSLNDMNTRTDYVRAAADSFEGYGKTIGIEKADHSNVGPIIHLPVNDYANGEGNVIVFEADFYIEKGEYQYDDTEISRGYQANAIYFQYNDKTYMEMKSNTWDGSAAVGTRLFSTEFDIVDSDKTLESKVAGGTYAEVDGVNQITSETTSDKVGGDCFKHPKSTNANDIDMGKWYKITFEFYFEEGIAAFYLDGELVATWSITVSDTMVANTNSVGITAMWRFRNCKFHLDNVFSGKIVKESSFN